MCNVSVCIWNRLFIYFRLHVTVYYGVRSQAPRTNPPQEPSGCTHVTLLCPSTISRIWHTHQNHAGWKMTFPDALSQNTSASGTEVELNVAIHCAWISVVKMELWQDEAKMGLEQCELTYLIKSGFTILLRCQTNCIPIGITEMHWSQRMASPLEVRHYFFSLENGER